MRQDEAVQAVTRAAMACPEVQAIFLKGSLANGTSDQYSDVDFYCLVADADLESFLPKRLGLLQSYRTVIYQSESNFVGPQLVAVFDDGLHFDLYTVTASTFPPVGTFRVLHDPKHLLDQFVGNCQDHSISHTELRARFNEFSFSLLEFLAAWRRQDLAWSHRLASHLAGDLGVVLRHRYDPANARLGTKRLESVLPAETRQRLRAALPGSGSKLPQDVLGLCALMRETMQGLEQAQGLSLDWRLFNLLSGQIAEEERL